MYSYVLSFFMKGDFIVLGSQFQILITTTETHLPVFNLRLGTNNCLEMDDLRILGISEKCRIIKLVVE